MQANCNALFTAFVHQTQPIATCLRGTMSAHVKDAGPDSKQIWRQAVDGSTN